MNRPSPSACVPERGPSLSQKSCSSNSCAWAANHCASAQKGSTPDLQPLPSTIQSDVRNHCRQPLGNPFKGACHTCWCTETTPLRRRETYKGALRCMNSCQARQAPSSCFNTFDPSIKCCLPNERDTMQRKWLKLTCAHHRWTGVLRCRWPRLVAAAGAPLSDVWYFDALRLLPPLPLVLCRPSLDEPTSRCLQVWGRGVQASGRRATAVGPLVCNDRPTAMPRCELQLSLQAPSRSIPAAKHFASTASSQDEMFRATQA